MDKVIKNYEEKTVDPMNTKEFFGFLKRRRDVKKHNKKHHQPIVQEHVHDENCGPEFANPIPKDIKVTALAIVIDNVVVDVMNAQQGLSEILLNNPKFIELDPKEERPQPGYIYENGKFIPFHDIVKEANVTFRG